MRNYLLAALTLFLFSCSQNTNTNQNASVMDIDSTLAKKDFHELNIMSLEGDSRIDFSSFQGKKVLIVNVASKCGYTYQYEGLQKLHEEHGDKVQIIGFPCNQFLFQEPGDKDKIRSFCSVNYGVTFPITEKIKVKGRGQHPIYKWLTKENLNKKGNYKVSWNFNKFLISENGELLNHFDSKKEPMGDEILSAIGAI